MIKKEELENYFAHNRQSITIKKLLAHFNVSDSDIDNFLTELINLEEQGKVLVYDNDYCLPIGEDFYLKHGIVKQSNRDNLYIDYGHGERIILSKKNFSKISPGTHVFVNLMESKKKSQHKMHHQGEIVKVTKGITPEHIASETLVKATVEREADTARLFVRVDNQKIYISDKKTNSAYPGDIVTASLVPGTRQMASVQKILKRKQKYHVFACEEKNGQKIWVPVGTNPFRIQDMPPDRTQLGERIIAEISKETPVGYHLKYIQKIKERPKAITKIEDSLLEHNFSLEFPLDVEKEANKVSGIIEKEELEIRRDLRNLTTFTIDSDTAKDLDDAISIEKDGDDYILYVHIADVSHYVKPTSKMFKEAMKRGTSVYPSNMCFPMIPPALSNGVCSLNPNEEKLTKTCKIKLDKNGTVLDYEVFKSVIKSDYKMSYAKINNLLTGKELDLNYIRFYKELVELSKLSNCLQNKRLSNGFLNFASDELIFDVDEFGNPISVKNRYQGIAEQIIENCMILANSTIAEFAYWLNSPFVYRNHEFPEIDKKRQLEKNLTKYTKKFKKINDIQNPKVLQAVLLSLSEGKTKEEIEKISELFLKYVPRAYYSPENSGHYGLATKCYGTFSSPIRKASDLLNHMFLDEILIHGMDDKKLSSIKEELPEICEYITSQQYEAEQVEIEVNRMLLQNLGRQYTGVPLQARITFFSEDGMYMKTEGQIPGYTPLNKKMKYIPEKNVLQDSRTNTVYHIGDYVTIKISDKQKGQRNQTLLFEIENEKEKENKPKVMQKKKEK